MPDSMAPSNAVTASARGRRRPESEYERLLREARDAQPMVTRCAVDGCDWPGVEGTALECREVALAHRREAHRGEVLERGVRKRAKAPVGRRPHEQTAEDKRIVATLAKRARRGRLTDERAAVALERARAGESANAIAVALAREWGYGSVEGCAQALRSLFAEHDVPRPVRAPRASRSPMPRRRGGRPAATAASSPRWGKLTERRAAACRVLYEAGISAGGIADLIWETYGYSNQNSCRVALRDRLRRDGVTMRPNTVQIAIPDLNRREAVAILAAAERSTLDEAA